MSFTLHRHNKDKHESERDIAIYKLLGIFDGIQILLSMEALEDFRTLFWGSLYCARLASFSTSYWSDVLGLPRWSMDNFLTKIIFVKLLLIVIAHSMCFLDQIFIWNPEGAEQIYCWWLVHCLLSKCHEMLAHIPSLHPSRTRDILEGEELIQPWKLGSL